MFTFTQNIRRQTACDRWWSRSFRRKSANAAAGIPNRSTNRPCCVLDMLLVEGTHVWATVAARCSVLTWADDGSWPGSWVTGTDVRRKINLGSTPVLPNCWIGSRLIFQVGPCIIIYYIVLYCIILYYIILYFILYYIIFYIIFIILHLLYLLYYIIKNYDILTILYYIILLY